MPDSSAQRTAARFGLWGSIAAFIGILLSGPLGLLIVGWVHPQPPWRNVEIFIANYHPIQSLPFLLGFLLVSGYVIMIAAIYHGATDWGRLSSLIAVMFTTIFAALIFFNYIVQTTLVPSLVTHHIPDYDSVIASFTMANPASLGWAIEMWGYGFLGVATILAAPAFRRNRLENIVSLLFILNGIISLTGAFLTALLPGWVMTPGGMWSYMGWNVLVLAISILTVIAFRRRERAA